MSGIVLRDYQTTMLDEARDHMRAGRRRVLLVAPTGAGKRMMACWAIGEAAARGKRCMFLVHRQELLDQASDTLRDAGIAHGIVASGMMLDEARDHMRAGRRRVLLDVPGIVHVASIATIARRLARLPVPDFLFVDEFHHAASATWAKILTRWQRAFVLGFTATPQRLDGKGLAKYADAMVVGPGVRDLITHDYLADYRLFAPPGPDLAGVRSHAGDFDRGELSAVVDRPQIVGDVVAHYQRLAPGRRALVFAASILHSQHLADALRKSAVAAAHVDGSMRRDERRRILDDFREGRSTALCSVDILGEGLDVPGIEAVVCARPTRSLTLCLQQWGRGLRPKPDGSKCIILDHAGNSSRHGLPDDDREWELTDDRKRRSASPGVSVCKRCFAVYRVGLAACPECGFAATPKPRNCARSRAIWWSGEDGSA